MNKNLPIYALTALVGIGIGWLMQRPTAVPTTQSQTNSISNTVDSAPPISDTESTTGTLHEEVTRLAKRLDEQSQVQKYQQEQIASLQLALKKAGKKASGNHDVEVLSTQDRGPIEQAQEGWFDVNAMIIAGVDEHEANRLRSFYEDIELKKLFLRDKAIREGWGNSARYGDEQSALEDQVSNLRNDIDEKTYDAFLYSSGRPNRVVVRSLLNNSPAEQAGAQAGDILISYGDKRVYSWDDIRTYTTQGQTSEMVPMVVQRDGKQQTLYVQRGPLGIKLDSTSVAP